MPRRSSRAKAPSPTMMDSDSAKIYLYGEIGESWWDEESITGKWIAEKLSEIPMDQTIELHINSIGGDVAEGLTIYNLLKKRKVKCYIDGYCLSAASFIALAAEEIYSPATSIWMVHNPSTICYGTSKDMRATADMLDVHLDSVMQIYRDRTNQSEEDLRALLDEETWFTGVEAVEMGFATAVVEEPIAVEQKIPYRVAACFKNTEDKLKELGWSIASKPSQRVAASASRSIAAPTAIAPEKIHEQVVNNPVDNLESPAMTESKIVQDDRESKIVQMGDRIRDLEAQIEQFKSASVAQSAALADAQSSEASLASQIDSLKIQCQYLKLRSQAIELYAVENKLEQDQFEYCFKDVESDLETFTAMSIDEARIKLAVYEHTLGYAASKKPIERVKDVAGVAKLTNTAVRSAAMDKASDRAGVSAAAQTPTGEDIDSFASRLVANLKVRP